MGNKICLECMDCYYKEIPIAKIDANDIIFCGYPFCNTDIMKLKNIDLLIEFNGIVYCSSECRKNHKKIDYIGRNWNII